jgi:lipopolysaccharide/colanic/teichoic acid biosynthesis glycosyltransferase
MSIEVEYSTGWRWSPATASLVGGQEKAIFYYICKRGLDLSLSLLALVILAPVMLLIAVAVKLDTPGPVFFRQERIGARRKLVGRRTVWETHKFQVIKFRSMVRHADDTLHRAYIRQFVEGTLAEHAQAGPTFKLNADPRVTRVGRFLRKSSLDELPQIINVLRGEMSLVGPRPVPEYEVLAYREAWHHERLATLPGLTGLWQVQGRGQVPFEEMVRLDLEYIRRQSLWLDLKIMVLTIPAVVTGRGAE